MIVIARHLLWHLGVAAGAIAVLSLFGMPFSSALAIGVMAGCVAMVFHGGHTGYGAAHPRVRPADRQEVEPS